MNVDIEVQYRTRYRSQIQNVGIDVSWVQYRHKRISKSARLILTFGKVPVQVWTWRSCLNIITFKVSRNRPVQHHEQHAGDSAELWHHAPLFCFCQWFLHCGQHPHHVRYCNGDADEAGRQDQGVKTWDEQPGVTRPCSASASSRTRWRWRLQWSWRCTWMKQGCT